MEDRQEVPEAADHSVHLDLLALYAEKKRIDVEIEKRENALKLRIGTAKGLGSIASWKEVQGVRLDQASLKLQRLDIYEAFSKQTRARRFMVSRNVDNGG